MLGAAVMFPERIFRMIKLIFHSQAEEGKEKSKTNMKFEKETDIEGRVVPAFK